ncbi:MULTISPECIES: hypothetical protein [unclassified Nocardioides]|uniref:hypothetical protein n=1 Tax=unclassified Nocardioides TaxID=2615069 RepID=UPI00266575FA|nr:hypothetical protein [Nocardioides sp. Arc9.136]WKN49826.1 hypothetical protein OSR43_06775 [Nocardioides sp. Arc9.136]
MAPSSLLPLLPTLVHRVRTWPEESQLRARRNAMVASTALARRRAERDDVEDFLAALAGTVVPATPVRRAAHG